MHVSDLEAGTTEMHEKFEAALAHLERESEEKDAEIEAANREIEKLGEQVYLLEEENDRIKEESERIREDDAVERERLEALSSALKDVQPRPLCLYGNHQLTLSIESRRPQGTIGRSSGALRSKKTGSRRPARPYRGAFPAHREPCR